MKIRKIENHEKGNSYSINLWIKIYRLEFKEKGC